MRVVRSGDVLEVYSYKNKVHYNYETMEKNMTGKNLTIGMEKGKKTCPGPGRRYVD